MVPPRPPTLYLGSSMNLMTIDSVHLSRGSRKVLENLSMTVGAGDRIVIRGDNGSGKTSLLKAVLGLLSLDSGAIRLKNQVVGSRGWSAIRSSVAWVPQDGVLHRFPVAAEEAVAVGLAGSRLSRRQRHSRVKDAMESAGAAHLAGRCFHRLSGGERQRLSIARCLAQGAELLLLDEPATALDADSRVRLMDLINGLPDIAMIAVTHEDDLFPSASWRHLRLEGGRLC